MNGNLARKRSRIDAFGAVLLAAVIGLMVASCRPGSGERGGDLPPDRAALQSALDAPDAAILRPAYAARGFAPIWTSNPQQLDGARQLVRRLEASASDGLSPEKYGVRTLSQRLGQAARAPLSERTRTELLLTTAYVDYVRDLHTPAPDDDVAYTDPDLQPAMRDRAEIARQLSAAAQPQLAIEAATRMNGFYARMRDALARQRSAAPADQAAETRLLRNLDRLRALPSAMGDRFVLVDVAANRLWLYENDRPVDSMKVVVGAPNEQTPSMAALIRYAIYNPFWNVPPDMTRDTYAPRIAAKLSALADLRMNAWSSFEADAQVLNPRAVDWSAVARGEAVGWLRQRPGPGNSMGAVKFMLPNELGIYLHDSPHRELFDKAQRFFSAGCIRVEDHRRLSRWLFGGAEIKAKGVSAEQRYDLPAPAPVYIVYLTAQVENGAVQVRPDIYGRDRVQLAATAGSPAPAVATANLRPAISLQGAGPATAAPAVRPTAGAAVAFERSPEAATAPAGPQPLPPPPPASPPAAARQAVQPVRAAAPAPVATPRPATTPMRLPGGCRIQAGVFRQRANADNLIKAMKPLGDARITERPSSDGGVVYSVALVGLPSREAAERALAALNRTGGKLGPLRVTGCAAAGG